MASPALTDRLRADVRDRRLAAPAIWITVGLAAIVGYLAYDGGTYDLASRNSLAIAVWWAILVGVGLGVWPLGRISLGAVVPGTLLVLYGAWALASTAWATSAENAVAEFDRIALYLGIYVLVVVLSTRRHLAYWLDGLALGGLAIGLLALTSRFFPAEFPQRHLIEFIPNARDRLSFPLDYWNGLGIFVAITIPLLLATAVRREGVLRSAAVACIPALAAVIYLTSSRGAVAALAVGAIVLLVAERRRAIVPVAAAFAAAGSAVAVAVVARGSEGWHPAIYLLAVCLATGLLVDVAAPRGTHLVSAIPRGVWIPAAAAIAAGLAAAAALSHPVARFERFTAIPKPAASSGGTAHLLSGNGSGRWQFWQAALDEFRSAPLHGRGAGSYEAWWSQHASFSYFVRDAHSLYLQTLGELGIVGFVLLVAALALGLSVAVGRLRRARGADRTAAAGLLAALAVYLVAAGIDWMWELTAVTVLGIVSLALLCGPAALPEPRLEEVRQGEPRPSRRFAAAAVVAVVAWAAICAEAIPLLADVEVRRSQADVRAQRGSAAVQHAANASKIEPWAATPYLQLALVQEAAGNLPEAHRAIEAAVRRDRTDWRLWLVAARIEKQQDATAAAVHSLARARSLNPRSPLFAAASRG